MFDGYTTPFDRFVAALEGAGAQVITNASGVMAQCPAHDDGTPSLSISEADDGRVLLKCFAECPTEEVLSVLGLGWGDLSPDGASRIPTAAGSGRRRTATTPWPPPTEAQLTERHAAYEALLGELRLAPLGREELALRGLDPDDMEAVGYRSIGRLEELDRALAALERVDLGVDLRQVPGFWRGKDDRLTFSAWTECLIVPVRDHTGRIVALKIRPPEPGRAGGKYFYASSRSHGGPPAFASAHVSTLAAPAEVVRITEGEIKADAATVLSGVRTISVPGVQAWSKAIPALSRLEPQPKTILVAFDQDGNEITQNSADALVRELFRRGYRVSKECWLPEHGKGIDDVLKNQHTVDEVPCEFSEYEFDLDDWSPSDRSAAFAILPAGDVVAATQPIRWLARGLLCHGTYGMLAGEAKSLKSYLALLIAVAIAAGESVLGVFEVDEPAPVLMLIGEGGAGLVGRRLKRVCEAYGVTADSLPLDLTFDVAPIDSPGFRLTVETWLSNHPGGLVIVDPYYAFHGRATDASNLFQEGALLTTLSEMTLKWNGTLLVVNHFNQTGGGRGLQRITQAGGAEWSDSWLLMSHRDKRQTPDAAAGEFELTLDIGSRQWGSRSYDLDVELGTLDPTTGEHDGDLTWQIDGAAPVGTDLRARIISALQDQPWELSKTQILREVRGNAERKNEAFDELSKDGVLICAKRSRREGERSVLRVVWALTADVESSVRPCDPFPPDYDPAADAFFVRPRLRSRT